MKHMVLAAWLFVMLGLAACNTTRGLGEDVEAAGEGMQDTAQDTEDELEDNRM